MIGRHQKTLIWIQFQSLDEGRIYVTSPDLPGLKIVGDDLTLLKRDIPMVVKDILYYGFNLIAEVEFVTPLEETLRLFKRHQEALTQAAPQTDTSAIKEAVVADIREAA